MPFPSQNIKEFLAEFEQNKAMALFLGSGTDMTLTPPYEGNCGIVVSYQL